MHRICEILVCVDIVFKSKRQHKHQGDTLPCAYIHPKLANGNVGLKNYIKETFGSA